MHPYAGFKLGPDSRIKCPGKIGRSDSQIRRSYRAKLHKMYVIFCKFRSKLAIKHTIAIKCKEKYDAVVVDCHHSLHLW